MDFLNVFQTMEKYEDTEREYVESQPSSPSRYTDTPINNVVDDFEKFNHSTMYYNLDGYISPNSFLRNTSQKEFRNYLISRKILSSLYNNQLPYHD